MQQRQAGAVALGHAAKIDVELRARSRSARRSARARRRPSSASSTPLTRNRPPPSASRLRLAHDSSSQADVAASARRLLHRAARDLRFQALDHGIESLLLNLRAEVRAERLHVRHAFDLHVVRLPALRRLAQRIVHRHARAVVAADFAAHGRDRVVRLALERQDLQAIGRELEQRLAVVLQQRLIERFDEALALLRRRRAPVLARAPAAPRTPYRSAAACSCRPARAPSSGSFCTRRDARRDPCSVSCATFVTSSCGPSCAACSAARAVRAASTASNTAPQDRQ